MKKRVMKKRIDPYVVKVKKQKAPKKRTNGSISFIKKLGDQFNGIRFILSWNTSLKQAKSPLSAGEFFLFRLLTCLALFLLAFNYGVHPLLCIPFALIGYYLPVFYLKRKIEKRLARCSQQLADALGTMSNSMRAGFSFMQAMKLIADDYPDPIGTEFEKTLKDIQYGRSMEDAFTRLLERLPDKELEITIQAMLIQRSSGGNLAVLLETVQQTISGRIQLKDEIRALTAQGKMSTWIITGLPIVLAIYLKLVNPSYFNQLVDHPLGIVMLAMGCIGIILGWFMLSKIARIEV
ncbi:type II secretion system F family protein [Thalassobacillus hwangdonensis]|uniref:Type II secretion system F family protein n=1 Tax=Thalassobacillus hwangdonensis TaxID=546108 RepID=A0ABW3L559_9BACI